MRKRERKWTADEVKTWYQITGAITYANKDDANIIVHKPNAMGWTVNWANPYAYLLQGAIIAIVYAIVSFFS